MFLLQCLVVGGALASGALDRARRLARPPCRGRPRAALRNSLLRLAADRYWEQDRDFRFTHVADPRGPIDAEHRAAQIGRTPWELEPRSA